MACSYQDSLDYLYSLQLFGIKLGLENIRNLLAKVGNPQENLQIIHIAGTNGKGSTAAALAGIFHAAKIPAGLYTSPHLHCFTERVRIDLQQIEESEVVTLVEELRPYAEELRTTFFEFTTALALLYFQRSGVQWTILETGLGGRLDATNVVTPELCLMTPISLDHTAYLGGTLAEVAVEKAGIFKAGVPAISGYQDPVADDILRAEAERIGIPLLRLGHDYHCISRSDSFTVSGTGVQLDHLSSVMPGRHQHHNLALAAVAADFLAHKGLNLSASAIRQGLERVVWPGRLEWLPDNILLDGAHNRAGAKKLAGYLQQGEMKNLHLVIGCKADKQSSELLLELLPFAERVYATQPPVDNAASAEALALQASQAGVPAESYADPITALQSALARRSAGETILVAGSLFLVAVIREYFHSDSGSLELVC